MSSLRGRSCAQLSPEWLAKVRRDLHPLRVQRWALSDKNPWLWSLPYCGERSECQPQAARSGNEACATRNAHRKRESAALDLYRDIRDATAKPRSSRSTATWSRSISPTSGRDEAQVASFDPRSLPAVSEVLDTIDQGAPAKASCASRC